MRLGALVGRMLVVVGELGVERRCVPIKLRTGRGDLLSARPEPLFHLLFVEICQPNSVL